MTSSGYPEYSSGTPSTKTRTRSPPKPLSEICAPLPSPPERRMLTPGLEIRKVFGLVRDDVLAATGRQQEPSIYGTLGGDDFIVYPKP